MARLLLALTVLAFVPLRAQACAQKLSLQGLVPSEYRLLDWQDLDTDQKPKMFSALVALVDYLDEEGTRTHTGGVMPFTLRQAMRIVEEQDKRTRYSKLILDGSGDLAAFVISSNEGIPRVHKLGVAPGNRNKHLATLLMVANATAIRDRGRDAVSLNVFSNNEAALKLYESLGFHKLNEGPSAKPPATVLELQADVDDVVSNGMEKF
jgi:ribosomal protein S18 acetylase RimI-like enzyme